MLRWGYYNGLFVQQNYLKNEVGDAELINFTWIRAKMDNLLSSPNLQSNSKLIVWLKYNLLIMCNTIYYVDVQLMYNNAYYTIIDEFISI